VASKKIGKHQASSMQRNGMAASAALLACGWRRLAAAYHGVANSSKRGVSIASEKAKSAAKNQVKAVAKASKRQRKAAQKRTAA
jgi:hypothetical protein